MSAFGVVTANAKAHHVSVPQNGHWLHFINGALGDLADWHR
jgi:hypothetical protein